MTAPGKAAPARSAARKPTISRPESDRGRHEPASFDPHRWLERYAASPEAADFPEQLIGVPFN